MYFDDYIEHPNATINPALLWEYDLILFDFKEMKQIVIQRVIERGTPNDWYAILNLYGIEEIKNTIKILPYLNDKDSNFVSVVFEIPKNEMKCYTNKQLKPRHWNA